ncbi:MAG TPA: carboxypeptidase regulatory-like domain-containing protein [Bryobacteraceae bacterium]|nr:carboxypeptidase regulatory-like domain-containing protein [Bryobacteraceae bacterium]
MKSLRTLAGWLAILMFAGLSTVFAQTITTGDIAGTVKDQSGAAVASATVTLKSLDTGETRTATANDSGTYRFTFLKPGSYTVQAASTGLSSDLVRVAVEVGQAPSIDLVAKVQSTRQVVEVNTAPPAVETDNANLSTTFTTQQVLELPAPGGDITTIAFTAPGVVLSTGMGYGNFSSHGLPGTSNLFTVNGDDYNDPYLNLNNSGASNLLLGQDEISEASVVSNAYSVQYGRQAGAQVNYVTKGGTNKIHADLLFNFNNHLMNANDFFNNALSTPRPYAVSRQWGADIGGPIWKNKLFFYSDSEGIYYSLPSTAVVSVPSPQLQSYILGHISAAQVPLYTQAFGQWNGAPGIGHAVPVVAGSGPLQDSSTRQVNGSAVSNLGCGAFAATNTPAPGGGVFGTNVSCASAFNENGLNTNKEWLETHRVDWNINDKQKIFFRFKGDHGFQPTFTDLVNPSLDAHSIQPQYEGQINHTYVISPTTVNNFIVSFLWYSAIFGPASTTAAQKILPFSFTFNDGGANGAYPPTGTGGFYELGGFYENGFYFPQGRDAGQGQIVDDVSFVKGNHTLKVGVNFRRNRVTDFSYESNTVGLYTFNSLTDFVNGVTDSATGSNYQQKFSPLLDAHIRFYNIGVYLQDEWAVKPNLKITYGIRFDRTANPLCVDNCFSNLTDAFSSADFQKGVSIPYNSSILAGQSHAYYSVDSVVPDPRFGVVWSPNAARGMVVRGGFGLFSDLSPGQLVSYIFNNPPFPFTPTINNGQTVNTANDPSSAAAAAQNEYNAFKSGFAAGDNLAALSSLVPGFGAFNYFSVPHHLATPEYAEWSFEIEQPIGSKNVLVATYSGNHGYNELLLNPWFNAYAQASYGAFAGLPTAPPDPRFAQVTQLTNAGYSNYDGLTVQFRRAFSHGFQGQVNYTWSHALDTISNGGANEPYAFCSGCAFTVLPNPSVAASYGNADYDIRNSLTADFVWDIPWKPTNRFLYNVLGNWTVSSKFYVRSGTPFSVYDALLGGSLSPNLSNPNFTVNMLASAVGPVNMNCGPSAVNTACFNSSQFVAAETETGFGNLARNAFRGPGYTDIDTSVFKNFNLTERLRFQLGASAYNVLNHPNFQNPNADVAEGGLGTITATAVPPTSAYGAFQGSAVSGRVLVVTGRFQF